ASYMLTLSDDVISNAQDYHLAVIRFNIPPGDIPYIYFRINEGLLQTDPNEGVYSCSLFYNNIEYQHYVTYIPLNPYSPPQPPSNNNGFQTDSPYYYIYGIEYFTYLLNNTLSSCYNDLIAADPSVLPLQVPFFEYNFT